MKSMLDTQPSLVLAEVTYASQKRYKTRQIVYFFLVCLFFVFVFFVVVVVVVASSNNIFTEKKKDQKVEGKVLFLLLLFPRRIFFLCDSIQHRSPLDPTIHVL